MFKVEKCEPEKRIESKYPNTHATMGQMIGINDEWIRYFGIGETNCDKGDKFNKEFGRELAEVKAHIDMLKNYKRRLIALTKKSEWRKKKDIRINQTIFEEASLYIDTHTLKNIKTIRVCNMDGKVLGIAKVEE